MLLVKLTPKISSDGTANPLFPPVKCSQRINTCSAIKHRASVAIAKYIPDSLRIGIPIIAPTKNETTTTIGTDVIN